MGPLCGPGSKGSEGSACPWQAGSKGGDIACGDEVYMPPVGGTHRYNCYCHILHCRSCSAPIAGQRWWRSRQRGSRRNAKHPIDTLQPLSSIIYRLSSTISPLPLKNPCDFISQGFFICRLAGGSGEPGGVFGIPFRPAGSSGWCRGGIPFPFFSPEGWSEYPNGTYGHCPGCGSSR